MPTRNARVLFNETPTGYPEPGKTDKYDDSQTIDVENVPLNGGFLVKILYLSIDPYMKWRMETSTAMSYAPPFTIGEPLQNFGVGIVLRSENPDIKAADHVHGLLPFQEYFIAANEKAYRVLPKDQGIPWSVYLGACGMTGKTAYYGWVAYAEAKKDETVFVSTGAGPVGSVVIQLAKKQGLKVIASAGSDEKVEFMKSIGADVAFNYKNKSTHEILEKNGPINIYWDNVGGQALDAAIDAAAPFARFIECGMISQYNLSTESPPYALKNLTKIVKKCLTLRGFLVTPLDEAYRDDFYATIPPMVANGEIKLLEDITEGLEGTGKALYAIQAGTNHGKSIIRVAAA
ncbi:NAD-P-binding protein [Rickenella mellea]|uniref:NAD-P-binding protein n=1 Tax=Rickenella mellea TaxID=50990 RepID=A0A4Y7PII8_9AGAM|nr:NAD-P-binding protein [Rickenella mellea]